MTLLPFTEFPTEVAQSISVIFTDIDDTITSDGKLLPEAYEALWKLKRAHIQVIPITGRCAGWVDHVARMWPVTGVVGENGAFYAYMDRSNKPPKLRMEYFADKTQIQTNRRKLDLIRQEILQKIPTVAVASDQPYRLFDLAIDFTEDVPSHSREDIQRIVEIFHKHGATTKISSIHVNGFLGEFDKLKMALKFGKERLDMDSKDLANHALFIGDSPNDQPMFDFFPHSVGVANIHNFTEDITKWPKYCTSQKGGLGFAEMVEIFLAKRQKESPPDNSATPLIRPIAICLCSNQGKILVFEDFDPVKKEYFYRPLGGGIEFGEYSKDTIRREFQEEVQLSLNDLKYLFTLENIFVCDGIAGHEIVQVYDGKLQDPTGYLRELIGHEDDPAQTAFRALWISKTEIDTKKRPLYPDGLYEKLVELRIF